jgi:hypothetical protein
MEQPLGPQVLARFFVQFRFPIAEGISASPEYQRATRLGARFREDADLPCTVQFANAQGIRLHVHPTPAGSIPVFVASERSDFVTLLRLFLYRNEPVAVPAAIGAYMIAGFRNWHRYHSGPANDQSFRIADRFIVLSSGPYSGISPDEMAVSEDGWRKLSVRIRLEHECAHYFTRRLFGSMANNVHDEILADYSGIVNACGAYRADWAARFLGLQPSAEALPGARLERYIPHDFSETDAHYLRRLTLRAIENLEQFDCDIAGERQPLHVPLAIWSLAALSLEALGSEQGARLLTEQFEHLLRRHRLHAAAGKTGSI